MEMMINENWACHLLVCIHLKLLQGPRGGRKLCRAVREADSIF